MPNGVSAGSITSDVTGYYDEVYFSPAQGAMVETTSGFNPTTGNPQFTTFKYTPAGNMAGPTISATPPDATGSTVFDRRWIVEQDQPVVGIRRVTVLVTLVGQAAASAITFQMSMVRP